MEETDSWRAQTKSCVHQDPGEKSSEPTRDWPRLARECPGVSSRGVSRWWPAAGSGALSAAVHAQDLEGSRHYLHHLQHSLASRQTQGGNTAPPINRKLD